jgi:hypothetical protein
MKKAALVSFFIMLFRWMEVHGRSRKKKIDESGEKDDEKDVFFNALEQLLRVYYSQLVFSMLRKGRTLPSSVIRNAFDGCIEWFDDISMTPFMKCIGSTAMMTEEKRFGQILSHNRYGITPAGG